MRGKRLAIPGLRTSAWLACQLWLSEAGLSGDDLDFEVVMFDEIPGRVAGGVAGGGGDGGGGDGGFDAGLLIHEGQLTYADAGLALGVDLGAWWTSTRGLPLPLGGNCLRRDLADDLGPGGLERVCGVLRRSIDFALSHRGEAIDFAMQYARDLETPLADRFVGMYVNDWTLDYGPRGREAVRRFIAEGAAAGLVPDPGPIDFVEPG